MNYQYHNQCNEGYKAEHRALPPAAEVSELMVSLPGISETRGRPSAATTQSQSGLWTGTGTTARGWSVGKDRAGEGAVYNMKLRNYSGHQQFSKDTLTITPGYCVWLSLSLVTQSF